MTSEIWELLEVLVSVVAGFLLAVFGDYIRRRCEKAEKERSVRTLLSLEVDQNVSLLREVHQDIQAESTRYEDTLESDKMGGYKAQGQPIQHLRRYGRLSGLSARVWKSQLDAIPDIYDRERTTQLYCFYADLREIQAAQVRFLEAGSSRDAWRMMQQILERMSKALDSYNDLSAL